MSAKSLWYVATSYHRSLVPSDTRNTRRSPSRIGWQDEEVRFPSASPFIPFMQLFCIVGYGHESRGVVKFEVPLGKGEGGGRAWMIAEALAEEEMLPRAL